MIAQSTAATAAAQCECVLMPVGLLAAFEQNALACYPHECCGVLVGKPGRRAAVQSVHAIPNGNSERPTERYQMDPRQLLRLDRMAEEHGQQIIGFYHSHPGQPAMPSETDARYAWPGYLYLIVGRIPSGQIEVKAWVYDEGTAAFGERAIVLTGLTPSLLGQTRQVRATRRVAREVKRCQ
jgi:proteasome lid subunit RPN8/RPN11